MLFTSVVQKSLEILATMGKFSFLFGVSVSEKVFNITDTLSRAMQKKSLCASEAKRYAAITLSSLKDLRLDANFDVFWHQLQEKATQLEHQ